MTQSEKARKQKIEDMRDVVQEVELQARYWKAMYDTKYWTLEDAKLKTSYDAHFLEVQKEAQAASEQLEKLAALNQINVSSENTAESLTTSGDIIV